MIADQAQKLRGLMQPTPKARTIAVASGKGGVGKSCISLNIAVLLAEAGKRVVLVDADLSLANLDVMLGVDAPMDLSRVMSGANRIEEIVIDLPCGVRFVPGASGLAQEEQFERIDLAGELTVLENDSDVIIVDCGAGISSQVLSFAHAADSTLVITTPEPTVRPPSRMANRTFSSMAIGETNSTLSLTLSPGIHISTSPSRLAEPVTSVVRK